jgi:hypothetical protein
MDQAYVQGLRDAKALLDEGILSEQEFMREKETLLKQREERIFERQRSTTAETDASAMAWNADDAAACARGCKFISDAALVEASSDFASVGCIGAVLGALRQHVAHAGLCACACAALSNLSTQEDTRERVGNAGAVEAIFAALEHHRGIVAVQHAGLSALGNLALSAYHRLTLSDAHGLINHIQEALERHAADDIVCEAALSVLANFFFDATFQPRLRQGEDSPLMSLALRAMRAHRERRGVMHAGIAVLVNLTWCNQNRAVCSLNPKLNHEAKVYALNPNLNPKPPNAKP